MMGRAIRDTKPALRKEEWKEHIRQYERLKSQLNKRRFTANTGAAATDLVMLPVLGPKMS